MALHLGFDLSATHKSVSLIRYVLRSRLVAGVSAVLSAGDGGNQCAFTALRNLENWTTEDAVFHKTEHYS